MSYQIDRGTAPGVYTDVIKVAAGVTSYTVSGLTVGVRYYFVVRSVDSAGVRSGPSNEVSVVAEKTTTTDPPPTDGGSSGGDGGTTEPPPTSSGSTVRVATEPALQTAVSALKSKTTIVLSPGTYKLTRPLVITGGFSAVEIRSSTGKASDVVLVGPPATTANPRPAALVISRMSGLKLSDFTITGTPGYAISFGESVAQPTLTRLRIQDDGEFVQVLPNSSGVGASRGVVDSCIFDYSGAGKNFPVGIDLRGAASWSLRSNKFTDPAPTSAVSFGPAVLAWLGSSATLVERNVFVNTTREIVLGLEPRSPNQHKAGIVRNNMIVRKAGTGSRGAAISVLDSPTTVVVHNTVLMSGTSTLAIDYAHPDTTNIYIANNLVDGKIVGRDGALALNETNLTTAAASMFVAPTKGDMRLRYDFSRTAIDMGALTPFAPTDALLKVRPKGAGTDIGAAEFYP